MINWLRKHWVLLAILALALVLRLYRIADTMTFLEDEGRDLLIVKRMIDQQRPVLLGPQTSTGNMYLGPLYYYIITPALLLAKMDPVGPAILIAISGVITTYLLYLLGKDWYSRAAGRMASFAFAILPLAVTSTRSSWNPNLVPLIATLMLLVYNRLVFARPTTKTWLAYGILIGIMVQLHYMALIYCGVMTLAIIWHKRSHLRELFSGAIWALLGFGLLLLPFIVFEIRNDWVNTGALTRFLQAKDEPNIRYHLPLWLWWDKVSKTTYRLISSTFTGKDAGPYSLPAVISFFTLVCFSTWQAIKTKHKPYLNILLIFLGSLAVLGIYQENIHLHYLEFALPLIMLLIAPTLLLKKRDLPSVILSCILAFLLGYGFSSSLKAISSGATHQVTKAKAVADYIVQKSAGEPYNVVSTQGMYTTPFQYFLAISDNPPSPTLAKRVFDICGGAPCPIDDETTTLLFLTGPGHPSIANYLGHPELNSFDTQRQMVSNEHVAIGVWVAEIVLK